MEKSFCKDCICLVEDTDKQWVCDELQKEIAKVEECPESEQEFEITIHEVLATTVTVKAKDVSEAKQKAGKMYYAEKVVLTAADFAYREMRDANSDEDYEEF